MRFAILALGLLLTTASAEEEITLQDILSIKEHIRQDREQIALLKEQMRGDEQDRGVDLLELKAVLTHQEEEIAQLNQEIAKAKKEKPLPAKKSQPMGCAPKAACPPDPCCEPVCCPKVYASLPPPCQRCPMAMRYHPAIEESQFAARGEFLIWKTAGNPLEYALPKQVNVTGANTGAIGPYEIVDYDWDPAFRLALQYRFCPDFWQAEVQYTYLSNSGSDSVNGGNNPNPAVGEPFLTGIFIQATGEALSRASASVDLNYHILDFYLARRFLLADSIIFKFLIGASGAWIDQDLDVRYDGFGVASSTTTSDWKYNAGGIKAGITNDWFLGKGFGIYSQLIFGGFIGNWKGNARNTSVDTTGLRQTLENWTYEDTRFAWTTQFQLGLSWQWLFENISLRLFAGYEMNPWININDIRASAVDGSTSQRFSRIRRGIICPQGVTLNVQVGY